MDDHGAECELARRATIATNHCEPSSARSLVRPHASCSRAGWQRKGRIDLR
jgi:hypothetical protein